MARKVGKENSKKKGWELRQKDSSWGYAIAHIIPLVWIYYAVTRRTITPFLYTSIGSLIIGFIVPEELSTALPILATPFLAKAGIVQAKEHGLLKLKEVNEDIGAETAQEYIKRIEKISDDDDKQEEVIKLATIALKFEKRSDAYVYRSAAKSLLGKYKGASKDITKAIEIEPVSPYYYFSATIKNE